MMIPDYHECHVCGKYTEHVPFRPDDIKGVLICKTCKTLTGTF